MKALFRSLKRRPRLFSETNYLYINCSKKDFQVDSHREPKPNTKDEGSLSLTTEKLDSQDFFAQEDLSSWGMSLEERRGCLSEEAEVEINLWLKDIKKTLLNKRANLLKTAAEEEVLNQIETMTYRIIGQSSASSVELTLPHPFGKRIFMSAHDAANWLIEQARDGLPDWP